MLNVHRQIRCHQRDVTSRPATPPRPHARCPGPVPRPAAAPGAVAAAVMPTGPASDPHRFGRVDDDGTVWLITSAGERVIGSWQAGDTEAAYAHFGRRFDDLATEVDLHGAAAGVRHRRRPQDQGRGGEHWPRVCRPPRARRRRRARGPVGRHRRARRLRGGEEKARREEQRAAQTARKEALAAEAEDLAANSTQWKAAGDRLRAILDEWKTISGLDRKTDDALWKRYSAARETFNRRRGSHFADLDRERAGVRAGQGAPVRAGRGAHRVDGLGRHQRARSAACSPSGRPPAAPPRTSTTRCGSGSRPPRTRSSRRATR